MVYNSDRLNTRKIEVRESVKNIHMGGASILGGGNDHLFI